MAVSPASRAARHRRSPAMSSYPSMWRRTRIGCSTPCLRIESASSPSGSASNRARTCCRDGRIWSTATICGTMAPPSRDIGMRASRPRPSPRACACVIVSCAPCHELLRELAICDRAAAGRVVLDHRLPVAGRFTDADVAGDEGLEQLGRMRAANFCEHVPGQSGACVKLRHEDAADLKVRVEVRTHELVRVEEVAQA